MKKIYVRLIIGADYEDETLVKYKIDFIKTLPISNVFVLINYQTLKKRDYYVNLLNENQVDKIFLWHGKFSEPEKVKRMEYMIKDLQDDDWIFNSDLDEFPQFKEKNMFQKITMSDADIVMGGIIDRFAKNYNVDVILEKDKPLEHQFPNSINMHQLFPNTKNCAFFKNNSECFQPKVVMHRKKIKVSCGYHIPLSEGKEFGTCIPVYHFKWFKGVRQRLDSEILDVPTANKHLHKNVLDDIELLKSMKVNEEILNL